MTLWTRVCDDTGGGHSASGHAILYFQGGVEDASLCLKALGCDPAARTDEYGPSFAMREAPSFAEASWHERGAGWDSKARRHVEAARSGWEPYRDEAAWRGACRQDLAEAVGHAMSHGDSHGRLLFCPRLETLALAMHSSYHLDTDPLAGRFGELCALASAGIPEGPNQAFVAKALAAGLDLCAHVGRAVALGDEEAPEAWAEHARGLGWAPFLALESSVGWGSTAGREGLRALATLLLFPAGAGQRDSLLGKASEAAACALMAWAADADVLTRREISRSGELLALCEAELVRRAVADPCAARPSAAPPRL